ncbi:hypothetical protein PTTG_26517 [Puccinia triticina 1-1 BBBD Race 1]|uniref:Uncharacterized protein n=2 Tax=Puccinia triticina TaxID=208348 RepID=A0A180GU96_PUCT1|nr:uncharacterized protein PtA15_4A589 [Puccinia triticina]OAV95948.1 hypothetical protein PTTG_26517 [Puccinia triticina 1-1 BBBD Race 1]WAQ84138.1 hypothetical protein PtA15_4A589 [Puccinia triticina]WAR54969.1 hypothetical protein PtB15_4B587 [Puccinia triticina]
MKYSRRNSPGNNMDLVNPKEADLIQQSDKRLYILQQLIRLELGEVDPEFDQQNQIQEGAEWFEKFPPGLFPSVDSQTWEQFFDSYFSDIEGAIIENKFEVYARNNQGSISNASQAAFGYILKTIDFMFERHFIAEERIIKLFQNNAALKLLSIYAFHEYQKGLSISTGLFPTAPTAQGFWKFGYKFFQVLTPQTNLRIDFELLIANLYLEGLKFKRFEEFDDFFLLFSSEKYHNIFKEGRKSDGQASMASNEIHAAIQDDVEKLVKMLKKILDEPKLKKKHLLAPCVCEVLDFISKNISEGIFNEVFAKQEERIMIEYEYHMILLPSRIKYTKAVANEFRVFANKFKKIYDPSDVYAMNSGYHKQVVKLNSAFVEKYEHLFHNHPDLYGRIVGLPRLRNMIRDEVHRWIGLNSKRLRKAKKKIDLKDT